MPSTVIKASLARLDEFFFGPDNTRWDLVRVGSALAVLLPLLLLGLSGNYERLYGHYGMLPRTEAIDIVYWPAFLFLMKSDPAWIWKIYWATVAATLCLALGLWTRIAAAITFFLYIATVQRNLISFNGECGILAFVLLALVFAPTPQRFSVDHLVLKKPLPVKTESWVARFLQFNVCLMYFFTTVGKLVGGWDLGSGEIWYQITLSDWFRFQEVEWLRAPWVCWLATDDRATGKTEHSDHAHLRRTHVAGLQRGDELVGEAAQYRTIVSARSPWFLLLPSADPRRCASADPERVYAPGRPLRVKN